MSPEIEWRVGEDAEQETIAQVIFSAGRSRRSRWIVISAIGPVTILHPLEDAPAIGPVFERFTCAYSNLCERLKCAPMPNACGRRV